MYNTKSTYILFGVKQKLGTHLEFINEEEEQKVEKKNKDENKKRK